MKKYLFLLATACLALTTFTSCSDDGDEADTPTTKEFFYGMWKCNKESTYNVTTGNIYHEQNADHTIIFYADGTMSYFDMPDFQWSFDSNTSTIYITYPATMSYHVEIVNEKQINLTYDNQFDDGMLYRTYLYFHKVLEDM